MRFPQPLTRATLLRRYKRFLADVMLEDGTETTAHVANPGAMLGLSRPGMTVWLSHSASPTRKLPLSWELVEADGALVGVNTHAANRLVADALSTNAIPELACYADIQPEVKYGEASRIDFLLTAEDRPPCWLEVKSVTLSRRPGLAEWPDCTSARAARHLAELEARVAHGDRAVVLFLVQRSDCDRFALAADLDPAFTEALRRVMSAGVERLCYDSSMDLQGIAVRQGIAWLGAE